MVLAIGSAQSDSNAAASLGSPASNPVLYCARRNSQRWFAGWKLKPKQIGSEGERLKRLAEKYFENIFILFEQNDRLIDQISQSHEPRHTSSNTGASPCDDSTAPVASRPVRETTLWANVGSCCFDGESFQRAGPN